ncbi:hypothetical protein DFH06DRAFT_1469080 [Mycena polygramma]|nr:hypothetical protein DFH06DRAFT_1469080 [Mycena polygramma]
MGRQNHNWRHRLATGATLLRFSTKMDHIHLLLRALSIPGNISENAARLFLRDNILVWFQDSELRPILQAAVVWSSIAHLAACLIGNPTFTKNFLPGSPHFFRAEEWDLAGDYNSILSDIGTLDTQEYEFDDDGERALGLTFVALSKAWQDFSFDSSESVNMAVSLLRSTGWAAIRREYPVTRVEWPYFKYLPIAPRFEVAFSIPLRESLSQAAVAARNKITENGPEEICLEENRALETVAKMIEDVASKISQPFIPLAEEEPHYWKNLRFQFDGDIGAVGGRQRRTNNF